MDSSIVNFINDNHILTLATSNGNVPYCSNLFYFYEHESNSLIFSSDSNTRHVREFLKNDIVSASIIFDTCEVNNIRGLQIVGSMVDLNAKEANIYRDKYILKFPYAVNMKLELWKLEMNYIKMTDNRVKFGHKIIWEKT
tara:strand:- start:12203 stop:12622 length:420 start_codon:yes stop_codon:yes gene_type:complete